MLIRALCDYYDELSKNDKIPRKGYKKIQASYIVCLNEDGTISDILELKNDAGKLFVSAFECANGKDFDFYPVKGETFEEQIWALIYEGFNPRFSDDKIGAIASLQKEGTEVIGLLSEDSDWRRLVKFTQYVRTRRSYARRQE